MSDQSLLIRQYLLLARRRAPLVAVLALTGLALGSMVAFSLPAQYTATARVLVISPQIPENLARSTVSSGAIERVRLIEQRMMTRQNLLEIAERYDVFADRRGMSSSAVVDEMRAATTIRNVALATTGRRQVTASAVDVAFRGRNPQVTAQVVNEFVTRLLDQNQRERNTQAASTLDFFSNEMRRLSREIERVENAIKQFKIDNDDALPESLSFRRAQLAELEQRIPQAATQALALQEQRLQLLDAVERGVSVVQAGAPASFEEQELRRLRQALVQQRAIYADSHPNIRSLQARISVLEAAAAAGATATDAAPDGVTDPIAARQIELIDNQIALLTRQTEEDAARVAALRDSIERTPAVEIALGGFQRELNALQMQMQQTQLRQADAATGERLEVTQQSERFELVEQAQPPNRPDSPNRPIIAAGGLALGGGLGAAIAFLLELLNGSIRSSRDLARRLDMRPVVIIPYIRTDRETVQRKWGVRLVVAAAFLMVPIGLYLVDTFYTPLPLLARRVLGMVGLDGLL